MRNQEPAWSPGPENRDPPTWLGAFSPDSLSITDDAPDHHEEPNFDDPNVRFPSVDALFPSGPVQSLDLSLFLARSGECSLPEAVPSHHQEPSVDAPFQPFPDMEKAFSGKPALSDVDKGLRRQVVKRNLKEIADRLIKHCTFTLFHKDLAVYQPPRWCILDRETRGAFLAKEVALLYPKESEFLGISDYQEIFAHLKNSFRINRMERIPALDYRYLCCEDCAYDCKEKRCVPHSERFFNFHTLNFRAGEIGQCGGDCWNRFLEDLTGGDDCLRQRILEMIGVIIAGYPSKSFFLLQGESGTGKSQLANFLRNLLGNDACFALNDISQLGDRWTTGALRGKLLCICGDVPDGPLTSKAIGTIKQLTGDDLIRGEVKYQNAFTFENTAKLLFVSNYPLQISSSQKEQALIQRLVFIPCRYPVPVDRQILGLHEQLLREAGYIVGLALEALDDLIAHNGAFTPIEADASEVFFQAKERGEEIFSFVHDCCLLEEEASCSVSALFTVFQEYAPESQLKAAEFSKCLAKKFPELHRFHTKDVRGFRGIRLKD
nr:phage/plasmid primase, P4 family [uncultured Oscillibacter sp.]